MGRATRSEPGMRESVAGRRAMSYPVCPDLEAPDNLDVPARVPRGEVLEELSLLGNVQRHPGLRGAGRARARPAVHRRGRRTHRRDGDARLADLQDDHVATPLAIEHLHLWMRVQGKVRGVARAAAAGERERLRSSFAPLSNGRSS